MNDITISKTLRFNDNVTIDLNGHTLTTNATYWSNYSNVEKTNIYFIDSSVANGGTPGKIVAKNYVFDLSYNETIITFENGVEIDTAAFSAWAFRISNAAKLTVNNAKVTGQFYLAQPYGGTTKVVFNNCEAIGNTYSGVIAQHGYASAAVEAVFNGGKFTATGGYVVMAQNGYGNITNKFITFNGTELNGTIQNRQNMILDGCTITGKVENYNGTVTYKNNTVVNGATMPDTEE
jgi:hypothetical protein